MPLAVAKAVVDGIGIADALALEGLLRGAGWPHDDTCDALRPLAEHGTGEGTFLVVRRTDRAVLGECGWFGVPDAAGRVEIGYGIAPSARRQGLGSQAVRLLLDWLCEQPRVGTVTAEVLVGNEPSLRLLAGLGFTPVDRMGDHVVLTITSSPR